jgi:TolB-like protein
MKKMTFFMAFLAIMAGSLFAQKANLAILPFTGGQGTEGEAVAELFSFDRRITDTFNPIPRTSIASAIRNEQRFQMDSGMTDSDTIVALGRQLGARYVLAGCIASFGNDKLVVISIMDIRNLQQIAGDYIIYNNINEFRDKMPSAVENIIKAMQANVAALPKLAIVPLQLQAGMDSRMADALSQLLAVHIIRSGAYTVYPRTKSLEQVMAEHKTQLSGEVADESIIGIGYGDNPDMVLSVAARSLDGTNMFNAMIINLETGAQVIGRSVDYKDINDGLRAMETLASDLVSTQEQVGQRLAEERKAEEERLAAERRAEATDAFLKNAGLGLGVLAGFHSVLNGTEHHGGFIHLGVLAELKLGKFFSLQAEMDFFNRFALSFDDRNDVTPDYISFTFSYMQIPILAKFNLSGESAYISPFIGIVFNIITDNRSELYIDYRREQIEVSIPNMFAFGSEFGLKLGRDRNWLLFADVRYAISLGELESSMDDDLSNFSGLSHIGDLSKLGEFSKLDISLGVRYVIPFRK